MGGRSSRAPAPGGAGRSRGTPFRETRRSERPETLHGGRNLVTPHLPERYGAGLLVVRPGPLWDVSVIVAKPGQTFAALGGERLYPYATPAGARAEGLELRPGDEATLVRTDLPHGLAEWRVRRAGVTARSSAASERA